MKPASGQTPALVLLEKEGVAYTLYTHEYDPEASRKGLQAAESLGISPERVFKTLMVWVDKDKPACAIIRSDHKLHLKAVAAALGGKSAAMMAPPDAERLTAYKTGGISPFGQKKRVPVLLDRHAFEQGRIFVNAGRRGLQCEIEAEPTASHFSWTVGAIAE
ncbi:Cys-tRNA(Pro) deacylase [Asaia platycodi]|uniref:Cys-tRNA(Pro) deacylase n=1 Tax=Asaia platycodi TaxID=610243 RepID=UPI0004720BA1|nr:Cys-tRNA(Pro) deacylase [Asaia platycodi]